MCASWLDLCSSTEPFPGERVPTVRAAGRADGTTIATLTGMRPLFAATFGVLIGQWLAFGVVPSPANLYGLGMAASERHDDAEALRIWSRAATLHPDNAMFHYRRAEVLAALGHRQSAAEAYRLALNLDPPHALAGLVREGLQRVDAAATRAGAFETVVPLEEARGVWVVAVLLNRSRPARFLVDTGSSVTLVSPGLGTTLGLSGRPAREAVELQTLSGLTMGSAGRLASLQVGGAELRDVPVVLHDPGPGIDGILGNTVLARYRVTLDGDRRLLHLATR
jgi:predicted aspartyl protease